MSRSGKNGLACLSLFTVFFSLACFGTFVHGPYCGAPSDDSVVISWSAEDPLPARIEYGQRDEFVVSGTLPMSLTVAAPAEDAPPTRHVDLSSLESATDYAYRVVLEGDGKEHPSEVGFFSTAPAPGTPVSFAVLADTQLQSEGVNRLELVGNAIADDPTPFAFVLHAGDVVESPVRPYWDHWFASFDAMLQRAPFLAVPGNHERNDRSYYDTFSLPPGAGFRDKRWWALHWGDVVVVGLDTNVRKPSDYYAQQDWAREHLSGHEPHKFVIFHHPVFSSDEYYGSGYSLDIIYHPIFVDAGVDIVFNGHSHHYEHIVRDGITYLVVGGGGATPRRTTPEHIRGSDISVEGHYFYVRIATTPDGIAAECVSVAREEGGTAVPTGGEILDAVFLPAQGGLQRRSPSQWAHLLAVAGIAAIALWAAFHAMGR